MNLLPQNLASKMTRERIAKIVFGVIAVIIILVFFGAGSATNTFQATSAGVSVTAPSFAQGGMRVSKGMAGGYAASESADMYAPVPMDQNAGSPTLPKDRKVIRNGSLSLVVNDVSVASKGIADIAARAGGFVESQNVYEYGAGNLQGSLTVRVPETAFTETVTQVKLLAVKVTNEQVSSSDVSAQVVDLEAQLKNYRAEEAQYQEIMKRAGKISDVLEVARALSQVRGNIERTQGQLNWLARQVDMSTLTVSLTPVANAKEVSDEWSPSLIVKESFRDLVASLTRLSGNLIFFIIGTLPILLIQLALLALVVWVVYRLGRLLLAKLTAAHLPGDNR